MGKMMRCWTIVLLMCFAPRPSQQSCNDYMVTKKVFFDVAIGADYWGRIVIGLFGDSVPLTVANFEKFASTEAGRSYVGTIFHRVFQDFAVQGGDFVSNPIDGSGSTSIFYEGAEFKDENFLYSNRIGWLAMANRGQNTNGCQFFINLSENQFLDGKYVVFGKVLSGLDVVYKISRMPKDDANRPLTNCTITYSKSFDPLKPYTVPIEATPALF